MAHGTDTAVSPQSVLPVALVETLAAVADLLAAARHPWWMIGSAAVALHGAAVDVADVDVLLAEDDARDILRSSGLRPCPGQPDRQFQSTLFARWQDPPLMVEFMSGLQIAAPHGWTLITLSTRVPVAVGGATLFVPSRAELHQLLLRFGRAKDLTRATLLGSQIVSEVDETHPPTTTSGSRSIDQKRGPPPGTVHSAMTAKPSAR